MKRWQIKLAAAAVSAICITAIFAIAREICWQQAVQDQQDELAAFNLRLLERAELVTAGAADAMRLISQTPVDLCSTSHIETMLRITVNNRFIDGLGYISGGTLRCTSWGPVRQEILVPDPDFYTRDGIGVVQSMKPKVAATDARVVMYLDKYDALINPERFVDVFSDVATSLVVASDSGIVVAAQNSPDATLVRSLLATPHAGLNSDYVYNALSENGWTVVSMRSRASISIRHNEALILPVAMIAALAIAGVASWFAHRRLSAAGELAAAIRSRQLFVLYQPVIELSSGMCVGAEALVRWKRADGIIESPDTFIPIAEANGLIGTITELVIAQVIVDLRSMLESDPSFHVGINLSSQDINSGEILDFLQAELAGTMIMPKQIWLEITERGFVAVETARDTIVRARARGHPIVIDDFGTGYSALNYLQSLPLDALKIDKSFVDTVGYETAFSPVTPYIIQMAETLGLHCVAEGIETQEQRNYLVDHGVEFGQGWLFSKPISQRDLRIFCLRCAEAPCVLPSDYAIGEGTTT